MKKLLLYTLFIFITFFSSSSYGDTISYYFDLNNENLPGGPWGMITLTEINNYKVDFEVDPFASAFSSISSNFGLQSFGFNESTSDGSKLSIQGLPSGWTWTYSEDSLGGFGPYGKFDIKEAGTGGSRRDPLTFSVIVTDSSFTISLSDFTTELSTLNYLFAGHIAGFIQNDIAGNLKTSAMFSTTGTPIPEPATMLLLGSGLLGLAGFARRKFRK